MPEDILGKAYEASVVELRKKQGIYYTPQYITNYIVTRSLGIGFDKLLEQIETSLLNKEHQSVKVLLKRFFSIKVLDPACGSGAFLISALQVIWQKYNQLHHLFEKYDYNFTKESNLTTKIILRHIYGNDLDENALKIAALNLWTQVKQIDPSEPDHLPLNLELNLSKGNSLVYLPFREVIETIQKEVSGEIIQLFELRSNLFEKPIENSSINEIMKIKTRIKGFLDKELENLLTSKDITPQYWVLDYWFVFFNEDGTIKEPKDQGFDYIIGNPPYFNIQTLAKTQTEFQFYLKSSPVWVDFYSAEADIHYFFTKLGIDLLKEGGFLGYIVSRYWLENDYALNLRKYISERTTIKEINDFREIHNFDKVGIHTLIQILQKKVASKTSIIDFRVAKDEKNGKELLSKDFKQLFQKDLSETAWIFEDKATIDIIAKIKEQGILLEEICENVSKGMDTGLNQAFIINEETIDKFNIEKILLRRVTKNSFIQKSYIIPSNLYLIYIPEEINIDDYPNTINYLEQFKGKLFNRWEVRKNNIPWYRLSTPRSRRLFETIKEKIFCPYRAESNRFGYDANLTFGMTDTTVIFPKEGVSVSYLLAILNSKVLEFYILTTGKKKGKVIEYFAEPLKKVPIKIDEVYKDKIINYEKELIKLTQQNVISNETQNLENSIDAIVFKLYNLRINEVRLILTTLEVIDTVKTDILNKFLNLE
jgi:hypothetical protein